MSTLREQLLKAGLVDEKQVRQAEKERRKQQGRPAAETAAQKRAAQQAQEAKVARDQALNRRNAAKAEAKAREAQVRQLIEQHRLPPSDSEMHYGFQHGKFVRRIAVDAVQRRQLGNGELAIACYGKSYALVPAAAAARIRERDPGAIVDLQSVGGGTSEDDAYKGFEVPDDLLW